MAQKIATLDVISGGRAMFGIGAGEAMNLDMYGIPHDRALAKIREYVTYVRGLWGRRKLKFNGEFFTAKNAYLQIQPVQKHIPIYMAANGPKARHVCGEIADGWYPFSETPELLATHKADVFAGMQAAGRVNTSDFEVSYNCFIAVADDTEAALDRVKFFKSSMLSMPVKLNEAYNLGLPEEHNLCDTTMDSECFDDMFANVDKVPDRAMQDFNIVGTPSEVMEQFAKFVTAGVTNFVLINRGPDFNGVFDYLHDHVIPYFNEGYSGNE
jgi:5,10-methylenetetrahydromethanopterin reductase